MRDMTITRASRRGTKTSPVENHPKRTTIRSDIRLTAEEVAVALDIARSDRVEAEIEAYALMKRAAVSCA